ncbi:LOW QUALITY PROTEIN: hypothetical protein QYF61_014079 [Mycteria americana]|uniref:Uncharacterized protein n=1 Tax=Mycteria americana TaxID=33587 RepID=A0AAN7MLY2_MYCAM|nr:LOW QUALITY PROTEIN: hypothetical protein QYF61_014079 [Mycteria americana]
MGLDKMIFEGPFQHKPFNNSMTVVLQWLSNGSTAQELLYNRSRQGCETDQRGCVQQQGLECNHTHGIGLNLKGMAAECLQVDIITSQTSPHTMPASHKKTYGLHHQQHSQQVEGGDAPPLLPSPKTPLEHCVQLWAQDRHGPGRAGPEEATKMVRGLGHLCYGERLTELGLCSLEKRQLQGDLTAAAQYLKGACRKEGERLLTRACSDRTRGLNEGGVRLDIGKKCLTMRVVRHWHRLPIEAVDAPSLEVFKVRLDGALSNLV